MKVTAKALLLFICTLTLWSCNGRNSASNTHVGLGFGKELVAENDSVALTRPEKC